MDNKKKMLELAGIDLGNACYMLDRAQSFISRVLAVNNEGIRAELSEEVYRQLSDAYFKFCEESSRLYWVVENLKREQGWK